MKRYLDLALSAGLDELTAETEGADQKLKAVLGEFAARPDFGESFSAMVSALRSREEAAPIEECVRMFGIQNSAGFLLACKLAELLACKPLARDPRTGRLALPVHQILRYAFKARQAFGEEGRYKDSAFAAGLAFDLLALLISADGDPADQKRLAEFVEARFAHGLRVASIALRIAPAKKDLRLERHLVSAALLREGAKAAMACLFPQYPEFMKACEKARVPLSLRNLFEKARFGGGHDALSRLLAWGMEPLSGAGDAAAAIDAPYELLQDKHRDEHDLASICFLAAHVARERLPSKAVGAVRAGDLRPEIKELDLSIDPAAFAGPGGKGKEGGT